MVKVPPVTSSGLSCLLRARGGEIGDRAGQPEEILLVGVLDDRDDKAPIERDGNSHIDILMVDDGLAVDRRVHDRYGAQRIDDGFHDERQVRELRAGALVLRLFCVANLRHAAEIHLEYGMYVRRGAAAGDHVLGDSLPHHRHRHDLTDQPRAIRLPRWSVPRRRRRPCGALPFDTFRATGACGRLRPGRTSCRW